MANLRELFLSVPEAWAPYAGNIGPTGTASVDRTATAYRLVVHEIPDQLREYLPVDTSQRFKIEGSTGRGNVTAAPWIATFDLRVTDSATQGLYPVYLFSVDLQRFYLSLGIGVTAFRDLFGSGSACLEKLGETKKLLRRLVDPQKFDLGAIELELVDEGHQGKLHYLYQHGSVASVRYDLNDLPAESVLRGDYRRMLDYYAELIDSDLVPSLSTIAEHLTTPPQEAVDIQFEELRPSPRPKKAWGNHGGRTHKHRNAQASKKVGTAGECRVVERERAALEKAGRADLAAQVIRLEDHNEQPGWDVRSFELDGTEKRIEVKSTRGARLTTVELTANEWAAATHRRLGPTYYLYIVTRALSKKPRIQWMRNPADLCRKGNVEVEPSAYKLRWVETR